MLNDRNKVSHLCVSGLLAAALLTVHPAQGQSVPAGAQTVNVEVQLAQRDEHQPVPFVLIQNHILFKARVDGQEVWALLDNGFHRSAIDLSFAEARQLSMSSPIGQGLTPTGTIELREAVNVPIEIPGQIRFRPPVVVTDLSAISQHAGVPVSFVMGADSFAFLSFFISPSQRTFQIAASGAMTPPPNSVALELKGDKPLLDISIEGRPATVSIDLGDDVTVALSERAAERLDLADRSSVAGQASGVEGGTVATRTTTARTIAFGPAVSDQVPVVITPGVLSDDGDGRIGMGILGSTNFLIDVKARRMWLVSPVGTSTPEIIAAAESAARLYKAGVTSEAERQFTWLREKAASPDDLNNLCWAKASAGILLEAAVQECSEAVKQSDGNASHLDSLGMALLRAGKFQESVAAYDRAIDKAQPASSYMGRALAYARMGDFRRARADRDEARKRDATIESVFADLGMQLALSSEQVPPSR